jgi:hypothetical protein
MIVNNWLSEIKVGDRVELKNLSELREKYKSELLERGYHEPCWNVGFFEELGGTRGKVESIEEVDENSSRDDILGRRIVVNFDERDYDNSFTEGSYVRAKELRII